MPACPAFIQALSGTNAKLKEYAIFALGNIAEDCLELRTIIVKMGALDPLAKLLHSKDKVIVRTVCWAVSNILKGTNNEFILKEFHKYSFVKEFWRLLESKEPGIISQVCWSMCYLTSHNEEGTGKLIEAKFPARIISALYKESPVAVILPALRTLGNMLAYNDKFNEQLLPMCKGILEFLALCVKHEHRGIQKESIWVVSNILAGPPSHAKPVIQAGFIPVLLNHLKKSQFDIKREAVHALKNASRDDKVLNQLVKNGIVPPLLSLIRIQDIDTIRTCLHFVERILERVKNGASIVEEAGGIEALETVQMIQNRDLWTHAGDLVDKYWGEDVDDFKENEPVEPVEYPPWRVGANQAAPEIKNSAPVFDFGKF
mmetsp:Transcript_7086/g.10813  ORF Transcript_7086/g.10813 Transcript_7086/m.10813 type:complete len:373 (-) Transcript_7086:149-1267(-)